MGHHLGLQIPVFFFSCWALVSSKTLVSKPRCAPKDLPREIEGRLKACF